MDVWSFFAARAAASADQPLLTWQPVGLPATVYTYSQIERAARALGGAMQRRGVLPGHRLMVHLDNCPEYLIAWLACAAVGAVAVTTNTRSAPDEVAYFAQHAEVKAVITQPRLLATIDTAVPAANLVICTDHDSGVPASPDRDVAAFSALVSESPDHCLTVLRSPLDECVVQYTSGTTARPKGVIWTHANVIWAARFNSGNLDMRPRDKVLVYTPMFHAMASSFGVFPVIRVGAQIVMTPKWSTSRFWDISLKHGCTWTGLIGLSLRALASTPSPPQHTYRLFGTGVCIDSFPGCGVKTIGWYGMTETVAACTIGDPFLPNRELSVGRPTAPYGVAVVREDGTPVEPEEPGEVRVLGTPGLSLFGGYLNDMEATAAQWDEQGWLRTGDMLVPHADGQLSFVERSRDTLRVGAENVAASEVERAVLTVDGVIEAAVVGRPDDALDEVPVVFVTTATADPALADRIHAACEAQLADFKVPRAVHLVPELPRSMMSKVNKAELRRVSEGGPALQAAIEGWLAGAEADGEA